MFQKSYRLLLLTVAIGLLITAVSDDICAALYHANGWAFPTLVRVFNDLFWTTLTALLVFRQVQRQRRTLLASEVGYRQLFDAHPQPMWIYHRQTLAFVAVNEAALLQYGYHRAEWMQLTIRDIRPKDELDHLEAMINRNQNGLNDLGTWRHCRKSGEVFPVSIVSHAIDFHGEPCKLVMATDVTELVRSKEMAQQAYQQEKALREESRLRAEVIDKINNLVIIVGEDSLIQWVNRAFSRFTGYTLEEVVGKRPDEVLAGPLTSGTALERLRMIVERREFFRDEMINYKKNGEWYWSQLNISPIYDEQGNFKFFISVESVITEKKQREQQVLAQHALLQEIAWSNSHELRRPVCSIVALISLLKDADTPEETAEYIALLDQTGQELDQLIRAISEKISQVENITVPAAVPNRAFPSD